MSSNVAQQSNINVHIDNSSRYKRDRTIESVPMKSSEQKERKVYIITNMWF